MKSFEQKWMFNGVPERPGNIYPSEFSVYDVYTSIMNSIPLYIAYENNEIYDELNSNYINFNDGMRLLRYIRKELRQNGYTYRRLFFPLTRNASIKNDNCSDQRIWFIAISNRKNDSFTVMRLEIISAYRFKHSEDESVKNFMIDKYGEDYFEKKPNYSIRISFCSSNWKIHNFLLKLCKKIANDFHTGDNPQELSPPETIHLIIQNMDNLHVYPYKFEDKDNMYSGKAEFIRLNYGSNFVKVDNFIKNNLKNYNKSGLYIFDGPPGTGKSSYIKHLFLSIRRKFYYMPMSLSEGGFDNPELIRFFLENPDGVYVIEDAERLVQKRKGDSKNLGIASLLNMSDGILSSLLNIQFIITFNTSIDDVDSALLRNGRLIYRHHFGPLDKEDVDYFFEYHGKTHIPHENTMHLCDMYKAITENII